MKKFLHRIRTHLWLVTLVVTIPAMAQVTVKGRVIDSIDKQGIPGVTVIAVGTTKGTVTDIEGNYSVQVDDESTILRYSFIGYVTQEQLVGSRTNIDISLDIEVKALEEIVVVGYGVQKKKEVTGAVGQIKADMIERNATSDVNSSLQGTIAGVNVQASSGAPGAVANIQIRGLGSFSGSSASPLYIVDGIPYSGNPNLSPAEIESIDVLKDGASAAIYGTRASNGVVLITTKMGSKDKINIDYSTYYGIQNITSGVPLLSTNDQITMSETAQRLLDGNTSQVAALNPGALSRETDFVGAVLNDNAPMQNHDLVLSGGSGDITLSSVLNYFSQDGVLKNSGFERLSARLNANVKKEKFEAFISLAARVSESEAEPFAIYQLGLAQRPYVPLPEGEGEVFVPYENPQNIGNFANQLVNRDNRAGQDLNAAASLKYEFVKGLTYMVRAGGNMALNQRSFWEPSYVVIAQNGEMENLSSRPEAQLEESNAKGTKWTLENVLNYTGSFGLHNLNLTAAYTIEQTKYARIESTKRSFLSNNTRVFNAANELVGITGEESTQSLLGLMGRVMYNFDERYIISASIRRDGSSNFGPNNRYAVFPGVSVGWNISQESFFKDAGLTAFIANMKLRASYAEVGNQNINPYQYTAQIEQGSNYPFGTEQDGSLQIGAIQRKFANQVIQWETNISRNIGLDVSFLQGRMNFTADVYSNSKQDMLLPVELPPSVGTWLPNSSGYNTVTRNVGNMVNEGIELSLNYRKFEGNFKWDLGGTFTKNRNEVTELPPGFGQFALGGGNPIPLQPRNDNTTFLAYGLPVASFLLIETDGVIQSQQELEAYSAGLPGGNFQLGDLKYIDANGDSVINDQDRVFLGSGTPEFELGLSGNMSYKNFDLFVQLYYAHGAEVYNGAKAAAYQSGRHRDLFYMWQPANEASDVPSFRNGAEHLNFRTWSDYFLEDGTYLRVRNISLGYTLPEAALNGKLTSIRVYVSAQNPFTFTNYTGFDPEVGYSENADVRGGGGNTLFNRGVDRGNYPISRRFLAGLQVKF